MGAEGEAAIDTKDFAAKRSVKYAVDCGIIALRQCFSE